MLQNFIRHTSVKALLLTAAIGFSAATALAEGTVQKVASTSDGYCHLKIPAARPSTLPNDKPELKSSSTGDVIDFYGPCNYDPTGNAETTAQRHTYIRQWGKF